MGRLIDADDIEFKKKFCKRFCTNLADVTTCERKENCGIMEWIDNQPTAYDVDKVVERLEKEQEDAYYKACKALSKENGARANALLDAIEIVKGGGQAE
mgnify:CR=1 FL=1